jgi:large subunit ribosomal protein L9
MKVVLTQDVPELGKADEIKEVADDYARDYLLPNGLAILATTDSSKQSRARDEARIKRARAQFSHVEPIAQHLNGQTIYFTIRGGKPDRQDDLITRDDIVEKIQQQFGLHIDGAMIELVEPIKQPGVYYLRLRLGTIVVAWLTVVAQLNPVEIELLQKINQALPSELG